jgi:c-di-GMP-binding flagellar brake protein YcgR
MKNNTMEIPEILKTGTVVEISFIVGNRAIGSYPGYIKQLTGHEQIDIGLPSLIDQELPLIKDHFVRIKIVEPHGLYNFQGQVLERKSGFFTLTYPAMFERLEQREYNRLSVIIPVIFQTKEKSVFTGHTADLSGGGTLIITEKEMMVNNRLELQFILPAGVVGNPISGEIRRRMVIYLPEGEGKKYIYGINFLQISDPDRKAILSYLSEKEFTTA